MSTHTVNRGAWGALFVLFVIVAFPAQAQRGHMMMSDEEMEKLMKERQEERMRQGMWGGSGWGMRGGMMGGMGPGMGMMGGMGPGMGMMGGMGPGMGMMGGMGPGMGMMGGMGHGMGMMGGMGHGMGMMGGMGHGMGMMGGMGPGMGMMGGMGHGMGMMGGMGPGMGPMSMLDLSEQQQKQIRDIHRSQRDKNWDRMGEIMNRRDKLQELYASDTPDPKAIGNVYGEIFDIKRQMIEDAVEARNQARNVLTKEQREQLEKWQQRMMGY